MVSFVPDSWSKHGLSLLIYLCNTRHGREGNHVCISLWSSRQRNAFYRSDFLLAILERRTIFQDVHKYKSELCVLKVSSYLADKSVSLVWSIVEVIFQKSSKMWWTRWHEWKLQLNFTKIVCSKYCKLAYDSSDIASWSSSICMSRFSFGSSLMMLQITFPRFFKCNIIRSLQGTNWFHHFRNIRFLYKKTLALFHSSFPSSRIFREIESVASSICICWFGVFRRQHYYILYDECLSSKQSLAVEFLQNILYKFLKISSWKVFHIISLNQLKLIQCIALFPE